MIRWARGALLLIAGSACLLAAPADCTVREALEMPEPELKRMQPRVFKGLLSYYEPGHRMAFLQDGTGAIYLQIKEARQVAAGDLVEVTGIVDPGINGRNLRGLDAASGPLIRKIGRGQWPEPLAETAEEVASGKSGAMWTRIEGRIIGVDIAGDRVRLSLDGVPGLPVHLPGITRQALAPGHLKGLRATIFGVPADALVSTRPPLMQRSLLVPSLDHVVIDPADRKARFDTPELMLHELRWIPESGGERGFAKVRGIVTALQAGRGFFLQRGTSCAWVQCTETAAPELDQRVECAGVPGAYHGAGVLFDGMWQPFGELLAPIEAVEAPIRAMLADELHGRLASLDGTVVESFRSPGEEILIVAIGDSSFPARLPRDESLPGLSAVERGSRVRVTGVCLNRPSPAVEFSSAGGRFQIQMRDAGDLAILARPPFWNTRRLAWSLAGLLVISLAAAAWVVALKRRVGQQEIVIREQVSSQAVHEERVRIAREWHDTFEQHFAGLTMQLDATATVLPPDTVPRQMLERAAEMADHSRSEARQAIWDLRAPEPEEGATFLAELDHSLRASWPEGGAPRLEIHGDEAASTLPRRATAHLLRIAHEAVANAHKHASAAVIRVVWTEGADEFQLLIEDDGKGIPPEEIGNASARGHFGLLGLRERAHKLKAALRIHSPSPGATGGTTVILILPRTALYAL